MHFGRQNRAFCRELPLPLSERIIVDVPSQREARVQICAWLGYQRLRFPDAFPCSRSTAAFPSPFFAMKVLVADKISPKGVEYLRKQPGFEVIEAYGSTPAKILELVKDVHAIAVRSETKIT